MSLKVLQASGQAIVIDRGRKQALSEGLSQSGPLDEYSFLWANHLLGNTQSCAMLEISLGNMKFQSLKPCMLAVTGANIQVAVNGQTQKLWASFSVNKGDIISIGFYQGRGTRLYLAIGGGFKAADVYQSKSCVVREGLGGHNKGKAVQQGDTLESPVREVSLCRQTPRALQKLPEKSQAIRFIPSYQWSDFASEAINAFCAQDYTLSPLIDRMGFRLEGTAIEKPQIEISSEGIALGSIQISNQGLPMVLMADRQSIGGYPKIGVVYRVDLGLLTQLAPGQTLRFIQGSIDEAWQLQQQRERFFD